MNAAQCKRYRALAEFVRSRAQADYAHVPPKRSHDERPPLLMIIATVEYFLALLDYADAATNTMTRAARLSEPRRFTARLEHAAEQWRGHPDYREDWRP